MKAATCHTADGEVFLIDCGTIHGFVKRRTEGAAFRALLHATKKTKQYFGLLARFRIVIIGHGKRIFRRSPWMYQDPLALLKVR